MPELSLNTEPLFHSTQIQPFHGLILQQKLMLMHSIDKNYNPVSFGHFFVMGEGGMGRETSLEE